MEYDTSNVEKCQKQATRRDMGGMGAYMWQYQRLRESVVTDGKGGVTMVRIQDDITLVEVLDRILADNAAEPPTTYKKQILIQMKNESLQDEAFCNEVERIIADSFWDNPQIDEIEDLINEMPEDLEKVLKRYGVIERAKDFAKLNKMAEGGAK